MPRKTADHQSASRRARKRLLLAITVPLGALGLTAFLSFSFARILLGVPKAAAPVVAILVSTAVLAVAAFIASRPRVRAADLVSLFGLVAGVALVAGGLGIVTGGTSADQEGTGQKPAETLMIAAQGIAFDRDTLEPPWGSLSRLSSRTAMWTPLTMWPSAPTAPRRRGCSLGRSSQGPHRARTASPRSIRARTSSAATSTRRR